LGRTGENAAGVQQHIGDVHRAVSGSDGPGGEQLRRLDRQTQGKCQPGEMVWAGRDEKGQQKTKGYGEENIAGYFAENRGPVQCQRSGIVKSPPIDPAQDFDSGLPVNRLWNGKGKEGRCDEAEHIQAEEGR
jgi:hypothetical protein